MNSVKCGLALVAGYVLGRTKKAKAAIGLGLWVSGRNHHAKDVLRDQAVRLVRSAEGEQLINQIRGPAVEAGRRAVVAVYEAKLGRLTDALAERTERLTSALGDSAKTVREGAGEAAREGAGAAREGAGEAAREGAGAAREGAGAVRETVGGVVGSAVPGRGRDRDGDGQRSAGGGDGQRSAGGGEEDEQRAPGGAEAQQSRSAESADTDQDESSEPGRAAEPDEPDESGSGEGKPEPAGERRVPDRSVGRRQAARRDPMEKVAAGSTGGESS